MVHMLMHRPNAGTQENRTDKKEGNQKFPNYEEQVSWQCSCSIISSDPSDCGAIGVEFF